MAYDRYEHWSPVHEEFGWEDEDGRWHPTGTGNPHHAAEAAAEEDLAGAYWWQQRVDDATYAAQQRRKRDPCFYKEHPHDYGYYEEN